MKPLEYPHFTQKHIERIVDGKTSDFLDVSDEIVIDESDEFVHCEKIVFWKTFGHKIKLTWRTYFGSPETVKTVYYIPIMVR